MYTIDDPSLLLKTEIYRGVIQRERRNGGGTTTVCVCKILTTQCILRREGNWNDVPTGSVEIMMYISLVMGDGYCQVMHERISNQISLFTEDRSMCCLL
jgi:hypothetical protein